MNKACDRLKRASNNGKAPVNQIAFEGQRFDMIRVRRWRERILHDRTTES